PLAREVLGAGGEPTAHLGANARDAVARYELGILAVRANADVGAVTIGEHVQARAEREIDTVPAHLARLDQPLARGERFLAGGADREVVRKDRHTATEHDDPPALVV